MKIQGVHVIGKGKIFVRGDVFFFWHKIFIVMI